MDSDWDAIVVGASFGGLAAAMELAGAGGRAAPRRGLRLGTTNFSTGLFTGASWPVNDLP